MAEVGRNDKNLEIEFWKNINGVAQVIPCILSRGKLLYHFILQKFM